MTGAGPGRRRPPAPRTGGRVYWVLIGAAIAWGILLLFLALAWPVESVNTGNAGVQPMRSLVATDGYGVLWPSAIPLLIAVIVGVLHHARPDARWARRTEWILSGALLLASVVGFATIIVGLYVLPEAVLLLAATGHAPTPRSGAPHSPGPR